MKKKAICCLLTIVLLFGVCAVPGAAAHTHSGPLQSLNVGTAGDVPCCGVFRCAACGQTYERSVTSADVGMPVVRLEGDLSGMTKENKITARLTFESAERSFETLTTMKWQGDSSLRYAKKNYSLSFITESGSKNKLTVRDDWGKQSKYCLKANWVDYSAARNIVSARLWGEIVHSEGRDDPVDGLLNGGAVDGFPVLLYSNGSFLGLYTFNMPKDKWIYGMGDGKKEGLIIANGYGNCPCMYTPIADTANPDGSQWEVEYSAGDDVVWLSQALNRLIETVATLDGQEFRDTVAQYMDVERTIDYLVFITALRAEDNRAKNIMWATYDGVKFSPLAYDLEGSWGMNWNGTFVTDAPEAYDTPIDTMFLQKMVSNYGEEIRARYAELRETVLSLPNIERLFNDFAAGISNVVYNAEADRWPTQPGVKHNNSVSQCLRYARSHLRWLDTTYGMSVDEKTARAYTAKFICLNGAKAYVYPDGNFGGTPQRAGAALSTDAAGTLTKNGGSISFRVTVPEGTAANVTLSPAAAGTLEGPEITGRPDEYRVTNVTDNLSIRLDAAANADEAQGYTVTFDCPADVRVLVYPGQDPNAAPTQAASTLSVDAETGIPTKNGGQVNFMPVCDDPNAVFTVSAAPNSYKKLKGYEETGVANLYRITKISGDLTVTIRRDTAHAHAYGYNYAQIPANADGHRSYCACGQNTVEPHRFERKTVGNEAYNVCADCGYSVKLTVSCKHICHSTNPFMQFFWKIELFFFKIFKTHRVCDCGELHY